MNVVESLQSLVVRRAAEIGGREGALSVRQLEERSSNERQPPVDGEPIFRTVRGGRWRANAFQTAVLGRAPVDATRTTPAAPGAGRRGAGLPDWATWHSLRDVFASSLIRQGVDVRTCMSLLGHTSAEETIRTYGRLWPGSEDNARSLLDELWAGAEGPLQGQSVRRTTSDLRR